jgi:hypothetical protein
MSRKVWSYVAHKDGMFAGAIAGSLDEPDRPASPKRAKAWKNEIAKFCGGFIANGFLITPTYSEDEFEALTKGMPMWKRPKKVQKKAADTADMFEQEGQES